MMGQVLRFSTALRMGREWCSARVPAGTAQARGTAGGTAGPADQDLNELSQLAEDLAVLHHTTLMMLQLRGNLMHSAAMSAWGLPLGLGSAEAPHVGLPQMEKELLGLPPGHASHVLGLSAEPSAGASGKPAMAFMPLMPLRAQILHGVHGVHASAAASSCQAGNDETPASMYACYPVDPTLTDESAELL